MVTIRIGSDTRRLEDVDDSWITRQVNNRRSEGLPVCVEVTIRTGSLDMKLATPACGLGVSGGRAARPDEAEVFQFWNKLHLLSADFSGGNVVAFIKQLRRVL
jgi:hypothetical protein